MGRIHRAKALAEMLGIATAGQVRFHRVLSSANRDEAQFDKADQLIGRERTGISMSRSYRRALKARPRL